ncbi:MAG: peptide chain release factor 1 [Kofleriaceae bacterium]|nr:peptide chain release factor 1 [Kofleriaceae bacterium]
MFEEAAFREKMAGLERRFAELSSLLADPEIIGKRAEFAKLSKEYSDIDDMVSAWRIYLKTEDDLKQAKAMLGESDDAEMREMAKEEISELEDSISKQQQSIKILLLPKDPLDKKNILLEIRGGTGGDEAALFAGDLFRMYMRFAEQKGWRTEQLSFTEGTSGGFKEVIVLIEGKNVYSLLKYESGVHRVQRVPSTESQGRVHTSAATVIVLPEAEEVDVQLNENELRFDVYRSSGPGGQSVNTTDSAVRVTHIPTGTVVICQNEKSQHKNKASALRVLRSRLLEAELAKQEESERSQRRALVKTGDRSEKIRTYNVPQDRLTDHRINLSKRNLKGVLDGDLDDIISALTAHAQAEALNQATEG